MKWDKLDWQTRGQFSNPGIGDRKIAWPSYNSANANPTCRICGGRKRGSRKCACGTDALWEVKGEIVSLKEIRHRTKAQMLTWHQNWLCEAFRVLCPGGVIKAFSSTRTNHWLISAMENVGFVSICFDAWAYSTGFPKSSDISKLIDKSMGVERPVIGYSKYAHKQKTAKALWGSLNPKKQYETAAGSETSIPWTGWGTSIKPAWEIIVVGQKPN
jgi:hypothetical protein